MKISKKIYYKIRFTLSSPLTLGSGENNYADRDIIRDASGRPYIPASSVAGVCRNALKAEYKDNYLGYIIKAGADNTKSSAEDSMVMFYDAVTEPDQKVVISVRDGVGLDEYKTVKAGAKYDMEVLEPGPTFMTFIEQNISDSKNVNVAGILADLFNTGKLTFGGKTTRGYGDVSVSEIKQKEFDLCNPDEASAWVSFDMYGFEGWDEYKESEEKLEMSETIITLSLRQKGGISIRKYTTRPGRDIAKNKKIPEPDYEQLTLSGDDSIPTIPGTSWAGAFGHQMRKVGLSEADYESLFGWVKGNKTQKALIRFSETQLEDADSVKMSRNAIDRFSGGAADGALFTERTYYNGHTELRISLRGKLNENQIGALSATVSDLGYGFMVVGGLTAVGRGLFVIEKINGKDVKENEVFETVKELLSVSGGER